MARTRHTPNNTTTTGAQPIYIDTRTISSKTNNPSVTLKDGTKVSTVGGDKTTQNWFAQKGTGPRLQTTTQTTSEQKTKTSPQSEATPTQTQPTTTKPTQKTTTQFNFNLTSKPINQDISTIPNINQFDTTKPNPLRDTTKKETQSTLSKIKKLTQQTKPPTPQTNTKESINSFNTAQKIYEQLVKNANEKIAEIESESTEFINKYQNKKNLTPSQRKKSITNTTTTNTKTSRIRKTINTNR